MNTPKIDRALQGLQKHSQQVETWYTWVEKRFQLNLTWLAERSSDPTKVAWLINSWLPQGKAISAINYAPE